MSGIDDFLRESGRKEQGLLTPGHSLNNPHDVGEESHVEHAIGFVKAHDLRFAQVNVATFTHVHDTAGCSDDDIDALSKGLCLLFEVSPSVNSEYDEAGIALEHAQFFCDLIGEFSRGCQNQSLEFTRWLAAFEDGQSKGSGFSRACARLADHIGSLTCNGDRVALNLSCEFPSHGV